MSVVAQLGITSHFESQFSKQQQPSQSERTRQVKVRQLIEPGNLSEFYLVLCVMQSETVTKKTLKFPNFPTVDTKRDGGGHQQRVSCHLPLHSAAKTQKEQRRAQTSALQQMSEQQIAIDSLSAQVMHCAASYMMFKRAPFKRVRRSLPRALPTCSSMCPLLFCMLWTPSIHSMFQTCLASG